MKTAISIPDRLFKQAEAAAKKLGLSRSKLVQIALEEFLAARRDAAITDAINRAIERDGGLDREDEQWLRFTADNLRELSKDEKR